MMKRIFCLVLCLVLALPAAFAETADTLPKKFVRQLTSGNGARGYVTLTASGVAEWLNYLLPFTATDIQIRATGEKQGEMSENVLDDDDWQIRFYAKDGAGNEAGTTWLYGNPEGLYFKSELLPDTLLTIPVEGFNLLYQLFRGEFSSMFFAFDPLEMKKSGLNGNASAYDAMADVFSIPAEEWEAQWLPVLEKYFLHLDLWLAGYGDPFFVKGDIGNATMSASYEIPVEDLKEEVKYIVSQVMYDNALQNLLLPHVTMEQRITYLNPQMLYFYEACIDAIELEGDLLLTREMSAKGELVSTMVSLPLPVLPDSLIAPVGEAAAALFGLPYEDLLAGMKRIVVHQSGAESTLTLSGDKRTISLKGVQMPVEEGNTAVEGTIRIVPNAGVQEAAVSAAFTCSYGHRIWQDEKYLNRDTTTLSLAVEPSLDMLSADDPFRSTYVDFQPVCVSCTVDYRNNPAQQDSPVQVNVGLDLQLPDAEVSADVVMRVATRITMNELPTTGATDYASLAEEKKTELLDTFVSNAILTMTNLNAPVSNTEGTTQQPSAEPTTVPLVTE